jgi:hypothetical protein
MADNSQVATGAGDFIRDKDRAGVKTQVTGLDLGIGTATENLMDGAMPMRYIAEASTATVITSGNGTLNATFTIETKGRPFVLLYLVQTTTITAGAFNLEITRDDATWITLPNPVGCPDVFDPDAMAQIILPYTFVASTNKTFIVSLAGARQLRLKTTTAMTGTGSITPFAAALSYFPWYRLDAFGNIQTITPAAGNVANSQVTATGSAATLLAARATRRYALIRNLDNTLSGYAGATTVTSANGMRIDAGESKRWDSTALCQIIAPSGGPVFAVEDYYD